MSDDLISRKALKAALNRNCTLELCPDYQTNWCEVCCPHNYFGDLIDCAPAVEPFEPDHVGAERLEARQRGYEAGYHEGMKIGKTLNPQIKHGEWITTERGYECSECGALHSDDYPFCHMCGADMRVRKGG